MKKPKKLPAFMFYPNDWLGNPKLLRCSFEARGLWIHILSILHNTDQRGAFVTGGVPWSREDVIETCATRISIEKSEKIFAELEKKGVISINKAGAYCSPRMVRDERLRQERAKAGQSGGYQKASKRLAKEGSSYSSSVSVSNTDKENIVSKDTIKERVAKAPEGVPKKRTQKAFKKPTPKEAQEYGDSIGFTGFSGQNYVDTNETKGWVYGKYDTPIKNWKSNIRQWKAFRAKQNTNDKTNLPSSTRNTASNTGIDTSNFKNVKRL